MTIEALRFLLLCLLAIPVVAAILVALLGAGRVVAIRWISLSATIACLVLAGILATHFALLRSEQEYDAVVSPTGVPTFRPEIVPGPRPNDPHSTQWNLLQLGPGAVQFYIGLDGLNIWLVVLTAVLMVSSVLASWHSPQVRERVNEYYAWLLLLETAMIGVFVAFDIVLFYIFFELTLVPLFFLIGIWGGPERRYAARKFFIYTLAGSMVTLLGVLGVVGFCYLQTQILTFSIPRLIEVANRLYRERDAAMLGYFTVQFWIFLALMVGFAVKVPLVPLHTWLPLAHVEAPTAGSVLLAGILLKIGAYGFMRLCLPLVPDASLTLGVQLIGTLAVIGIIYGAVCALAQSDIKKLVAYSSVSHLGFCMLGMFALNVAGLSGSLLQMINHGLSTGALFLLVGMLYDRYHTRRMEDYGGMAARLRVLACFMVFICLSSVGLPGLNGFVGEVLVFLGMYASRPLMAVVGTAGVVLGAWYLLRLLARVFFGPVKEPDPEGHGPAADLNLRELLCLLPIGILCIVLGVYPQPVLDASRQDIKVVADLTQRAGERHRAQLATAGNPADMARLPGEEPR